MPRLPLLLVVFLLAFLSPASAQEAESLPSLIRRVKRAVVIINTYDCDGKPLRHGNGFFVEQNRLITGLHVLEGACQARIRTFNDHDYPVQGIIAVDEEHDLVLLQTALPSSQIAALPVEATPPRTGEEIFVISNPRGTSWEVGRGITLSPWNFQHVGDVLRITSSIRHGSSGSPVVNRHGRVVGVAAMQIRSAEELNFAVPVQWIRALQGGPLRSLSGFTAQTSK